MALFHNKYRIETIRLPGWDYTRTGYYFVTICTKDRGHIFGEVVGGSVELTAAGCAVAGEWENTFKLRPDTQSDAFVIMPNHVHGIIRIDHDHTRRDVARYVSTIENATDNFFSQISPDSGSLSAIVRSFKSAVTRQIRPQGYAEGIWQPRFYERVIRDEYELNRIRQYIIENPVYWDEDELNDRAVVDSLATTGDIDCDTNIVET